MRTTKAQSACASAQSDQRLCCSLPRSYNISSFYIQNFQTLAGFCGCAGRFVSYLVENPEDSFSSRGSFDNWFRRICCILSKGILKTNYFIFLPVDQNTPLIFVIVKQSFVYQKWTLPALCTNKIQVMP